MKRITTTATLGLILVAGLAFAKGDRTDPDAKARSDLMREQGMAAKVLGDMAGEKTAFDAAAAEAAKAKLIETSAAIATAFAQPGGADPASEAKAEIWTNWDDFLTKASGLGTAATAMDASSLDGIRAGMGGVGDACVACHKVYRM